MLTGRVTRSSVFDAAFPLGINDLLGHKPTWKDMGRFKGPVLRNLAARGPYVHNGFAATLTEVIDFYDARFGIGFSPHEKADLVAFLKAL